MYRRVAQHLTLRTAIAFTICIALLPIPGISFLISGAAQGQREERKPKPRPGKPEGEFPDLEDVKNESHIQREASPPIPSTIRSRKNPLQPWDGRRVGDPGTHGALGDNRTERGSAGSTLTANTKPLTERRQTRRAHARARVAPPPVLESSFLQNFFSWGVTRSPFSNETTYWNDQLRVAHANSQTALKLAAIELGRTLFESAEYAARNRDNHWYVYDLYKTYLMRDPDAGGWAFWEGQVPANGRESIRRAFEESGEFATLMANISLSGAPTSAAASLVSARVDPRNQPGNGMLTRDASWSVPLLSLPGRSGLDLGLALAYSSMVWTRSGPYIYFDEDNGFPSPGFRLGFPTVERKVFDAQTGTNAYLMLTAGGRRVELRQVDTSNIYDAADSSYLRLTEDGAALRVHATDGTRLSFTEANGEYRCIEVKDRNGNYLTVNYNALGRITTITDTLGRLINFNYDGNANLLSITQTWDQQPSHQWVSFGWGTRTMQSSFSDSTLRGVIGTANGTVLPVITQVNLNDTSHFTFNYTNSLQLSEVRNYFGSLERNATTFTYHTPAGDTPRLLDSRVSARNWTGINDVPSQVITQFSVDGDGACVLTAPDGTVYKEYYGTGWQKGLTILSEIWSGGQRVKWTTTAWQQDTGDSFEVNPRVIETNIYDVEGHRKRTTFDYYPTSDFSLPKNVYEYDANATTLLRRTYKEYNLHPAYRDRRIIGLVFAHHVYDGANNLVSKFQNSYDWDGAWLVNQAGATQHDAANYPLSFVLGRGNLVETVQYDVQFPSDPGQARAVQRQGYNSLGSVMFSADANWHRSDIIYTDSFSDGVNRNTFAYPTTVTDPDGFSSSVQYRFDLGVTTRTQGPPPAGQWQGAIQTMTYTNLGQLERITTTNNGAYKRFWYGAEFTASYATVNNVADELYTVQYTDGAGRAINAVSNHPGSDGGYSLVNSIYNLMGRVWKTSNPTEVNSSLAPSGDDAPGIYYTQQTYDWQGRPLRTTHPDNTYREASYSGCGCAGEAVVTLTDEGTIDEGVVKRRQQKIHVDILGRTVKTEILNWQGGTVYSANVNTYNPRDQITQSRHYEGSEASGTYQDTMMTYDGYGRLKTKHLPEQNASTATTWVYNADDTVQSITDARGATSTCTYNNKRHLPNLVTHTLSGSNTIVESFGYDAAGNRSSMTDSAGNTSYQYDELSRLVSETRQFNGLAGSFLLTYQYNLAGQLTNLTYPNFHTGYAYDTLGRTKSVTGPPRWTGVTQYVSDIQYRASDSYKAIFYASGTSLSVAYNSRLQLQSYKIKTFSNNQWSDAAHVEPQYFADGSVRTANDFFVSRFNRSFSFDHVGRLTQSASDVYNQTFQYDAFGNTRNRQSTIWSQSDTFTASWLNGRNQDPVWQYDANGKVRFDNDFEYIYNAKGLNTKIRVLSNNLWISQTDDAEGLMLKRSTGNATSTFSTTYYLRSTVLGGKVVAEYNLAGQQLKRYAYLDGHLLATEPTESSNFRIEHVNPLTGSRGQSFWNGLTGSYFRTVEPDSSGVVDVGFFDPNEIPPPPPEEPDIASILPGPGGQCRVEGIQSEFGCYLALRMLAGKTALRCPNDDCNAHPMTVTHIVAGKIESISRFFVTLGDPGWDGSLDGTYGWIPPLRNKVDLNDPNQAKRIVSQIPQLLRTEQLTRVGSQQLQNPLIQNNPETIKSKGSKNCAFTISFKSGTFYDSARTLPNGPGTIILKGRPYVGLGFTVTGKTLSGGGIGRIGTQINPLNPTGQWTLEQYTSSYAKQNGQFVEIEKRIQQGGPAWMDISLEGYLSATDWTNKFDRYDHPALKPNETTFKNQSFLIKVYKGKEVCEAEFHIIQRGNTVNWGVGGQGTWPQQ